MRMDTERKFSPRFAFHALNISIVVVFFALVLLQNAFGDVWQKYQKDIIAIRQLTPSPTPQVLAATDNVLWLVTKVVDGDTIEVQFEGVKETIRFIGIDTPETKDPRKPVQCFGQEASNKMKELVENKQVILESDPSQGELDKYGRLLRFLFLPDGTNVSWWHFCCQFDTNRFLLPLFRSKYGILRLLLPGDFSRLPSIIV